MSREDALRVLFPEDKGTDLTPQHHAEPRPSALVRTDFGTPEVRRDGDEFMLTWPTFGVGIGVTQLHERGDGLSAEVTIESEVAGHLHWGTLNLASTAGRETLVKKLDSAHKDTPWRRLLDHTCRAVAEAFRAGAPVVVLHPNPRLEMRFQIDKFTPAGDTTVLFADGGSGKSLLALASGVAVTTQATLPGGLRPLQRTNVLYLDWESTQEVHEDRLHGLLTGLGIHEAPGLHYRPMHRALADDIQRLRIEVSKRDVGFVIVDSYGGACGAEPETADSAIRLMNALRSFGSTVTRLVIAHVSKASADQRGGSSRPYGSCVRSKPREKRLGGQKARGRERRHLDPRLVPSKGQSGPTVSAVRLPCHVRRRGDSARLPGPSRRAGPARPDKSFVPDQAFSEGRGSYGLRPCEGSRRRQRDRWPHASPSRDPRQSRQT